MHGSKHLLRPHALFSEQSASVMHSKRQYGGEPIQFGKHVHFITLSVTWHWEYGPHGDKSHKSTSKSLRSK